MNSWKTSGYHWRKQELFTSSADTKYLVQFWYSPGENYCAFFPWWPPGSYNLPHSDTASSLTQKAFVQQVIQTQFGILKNGVKRVVQLTILTPKIDLEPIGYMGPAKAH